MEASEVLVATAEWKSTFPGAVVGALVMRGVRNPEQRAALEVADADRVVTANAWCT